MGLPASLKTLTSANGFDLEESNPGAGYYTFKYNPTPELPGHEIKVGTCVKANGEFVELTCEVLVESGSQLFNMDIYSIEAGDDLPEDPLNEYLTARIEERLGEELLR